MPKLTNIPAVLVGGPHDGRRMLIGAADFRLSLPDGEMPLERDPTVYVHVHTLKYEGTRIFVPAREA